MTRRIRVHYITQPGQKVVLLERDANGEVIIRETEADSQGNNVYTDNGDTTIVYRWGVKLNDNVQDIERERHDRVIPSVMSDVLVTDEWRATTSFPDVLKSEAFANAVFHQNENIKAAPSPKAGTIVIRLQEPRIATNQAFCIVSKQIINWNTEKAMVMQEYEHNCWQIELPVTPLFHELEFKFGIWDTENNCFVEFEQGENRQLSWSHEVDNIYVYNTYNYSSPWRAAGVAVPVFSLRTSKSRGCGEFLDLKALADWCKSSGLKVIQLLPINDTTATFQWRDSYPYNSISCQALHPSYISVDAVYSYYGERMSSIDKETGLFINDLTLLDYNRVREWKDKCLRVVFDKKFDEIVADKEFQSYLKNNAWWVRDYALFATLRNEFETPDFRKWGEFSQYNHKFIEEAFKPKNERYHAVMYRVFLQFHLEKQIKEAIEYVHSLDIALKGDLPIGINPNSVEAWVSPEYFDFHLQAGAPPDFFSRDGQNWGFPIYNWERMSQDGYKWWQQRFGRMQQFFDAFRIDHILGFFRIWAIPFPFKSGLMGMFAPAMPFSKYELEQRGFFADPEILSRPIVTEEYLRSQIAEESDKAIADMFERISGGVYRLKPEYFDPNVINKWLDEKVVRASERERIRQGFNNILHEVLFVSTKDGEYHPRIMLTETARFSMLSESDQNALRGIHDYFFYERHNDFWRSNAIEHLEALLSHCKMLVCGEDLGMIPASVPEVMRRMQILALEIQRMPKLNWERYGNPARYDYMTVCATSSHDISSIRGWWEENLDETQWFYSNILHQGGVAPRVATQEMVRMVVNNHLNSPSMLCINPLQDYAGMIDNMPHLLPHEERINDPANANHLWRYRIPFAIDKLEERTPQLQELVRSMVVASGRVVD